MALPAFDPYYGGTDTLLKKLKQQKTLSGMSPLTEEQLAAYTYGQRKSESEAALAREQMAKNFEIAQMNNMINWQRNRALANESSNRGAGQTVAGAISLANLANQVYPGGLKGIGQALVTGAKAVPGLVGGAYAGARDLMYGAPVAALPADYLGPYGGYTPDMFAGATDYSTWPSYEMYGADLTGLGGFTDFTGGDINWGAWDMSYY